MTRGALQLSDLGQAIQDLLKQSKRETTQEDIELLSLVTVRQLARIYDMLARGMDPDDILDSLKRGVTKLKSAEEVAADHARRQRAGLQAERDKRRQALLDRMQKEDSRAKYFRDLEEKVALDKESEAALAEQRAAAHEATMKARQAARDARLEAGGVAYSSSDDEDDKGATLGGDLKVADVRRRHVEPSAAKAANSRGGAFGDDDDEVWGEGIGNALQQQRRAADYKKDMAAEELAALSAADLAAAFAEKARAEADMGLTKEELAALADARAVSVDSAKRRTADKDAEEARVRAAGDARGSPTLYHGNLKKYACLARRADLVARMSSASAIEAERKAAAHDKRSGLSPIDCSKRVNERKVHLDQARARLARRSDDEKSIWADSLVGKTLEERLQEEERARAEDEEMGLDEEDCNFEATERARHVVLADRRRGTGPHARRADILAAMPRRAALREEVRLSLDEEASLPPAEVANLKNARAKALEAARGRLADTAGNITPAASRASFIARRPKRQKDEDAWVRCYEVGLEFSPEERRAAAEARGMALEAAKRRIKDEDAARKAGEELGRWRELAIRADDLVTVPKSRQQAAEAAAKRTDEEIGVSPGELTARAEERARHFDMAVRRFEPSEEVLARLADELMAMSPAERQATENDLRNRDLDLRSSADMMHWAAERARHLVWAAARQQDSKKAGLSPAEATHWKVAARQADILIRLPPSVMEDELKRLREEAVIEGEDSSASEADRMKHIELAEARKATPAVASLAAVSTRASRQVRLPKREQMIEESRMARSEQADLTPTEAAANEANRSVAADEARRRLPGEKEEERHVDGNAATWRALAIAADKLVLMPSSKQEEAEAQFQRIDAELGLPPNEATAAAELRAKHIEWAKERLGLLGDVLLRAGANAPAQLEKWKDQDRRAGMTSEEIVDRGIAREKAGEDSAKRMAALGAALAKLPDARITKELDQFKRTDQELGLTPDEQRQMHQLRQEAIEAARKRGDVPLTDEERALADKFDARHAASLERSTLDLSPEEEESFAKRADEILQMPESKRAAACAEDTAADDALKLPEAERIARGLHRARHMDMARARKKDEANAKTSDPAKWRKSARAADRVARAPQGQEAVVEAECRAAGAVATDWPVQKRLAEARFRTQQVTTPLVAKSAALARLSPAAAAEEEARSKRIEEDLGVPSDLARSEASKRAKEFAAAKARNADERDPSHAAWAAENPHKWRWNAARADAVVKLAPAKLKETEAAWRRDDAEMGLSAAEQAAAEADRAKHLELARRRADAKQLGNNKGGALVDPNDSGEVWGEGVGSEVECRRRAAVWVQELDLEGICGMAAAKRKKALEERHQEDEDLGLSKDELDSAANERDIAVAKIQTRFEECRSAEKDKDGVLFGHKSAAKFKNLSRRAELVAAMSPKMQADAERLAAAHDANVLRLSAAKCEARAAERQLHLAAATARLQRMRDGCSSHWADKVASKSAEEIKAATAAASAAEAAKGAGPQELSRYSAERARHLDLARARAADLPGASEKTKAVARYCDNALRNGIPHGVLAGEMAVMTIDDEEMHGVQAATAAKEERQQQLTAANKRAAKEEGPSRNPLGAAGELAPNAALAASDLARQPRAYQTEVLRRHRALDELTFPAPAVAARAAARSSFLEQARLRNKDEDAAVASGADAADWRVRAIAADSLVRLPASQRSAAEAALKAQDGARNISASAKEALAKDRATHYKLALARYIPTEEDLARRADQLVDLSKEARADAESEARRLDADRGWTPHEAANMATARARHLEMAVRRREDEMAENPSDKAAFKEEAIQADLLHQLPAAAASRILQKRAAAEAKSLGPAAAKAAEETRNHHSKLAAQRAGKKLVALPNQQATFLSRLPKNKAAAEEERITTADEDAGLTAPEQRAQVAARAIAAEEASRRLRDEKAEEASLKGDVATWRPLAIAADRLALMPDAAAQAALEELARADKEILKVGPEEAAQLAAARNKHLALAKARLLRNADRRAYLPEVDRMREDEMLARLEKDQGVPTEVRSAADEIRHRNDDVAHRALVNELKKIAAEPASAHAAGLARMRANDEKEGYLPEEVAARAATREDIFKRVLKGEFGAIDAGAIKAEEANLDETFASARAAPEEQQEERVGLDLTPSEEESFARRADEIMALPAPARAAACAETSNEDDKLGLGEPQRIARAMHRARHLAMAKARKDHEEEASPADTEAWRAEARLADKLIRLPLSAQKKQEAELKAAGSLPADYTTAKRLAAKRLTDSPLTSHIASATGLERLPKAAQRAAEEQAKKHDEELGLTAEEAKTEAAKRAQALDRARKRHEDERKEAALGPITDPHGFRAEQAIADHVVRLPRDKQEDAEAARQVEDEEAGIPEDERDEREATRAIHLEQALVRLNGSRGGAAAVNLPQELCDSMQKRADEIYAMDPSEWQAAIEEDRLKDASVPGITNHDLLARQAERARALVMGKARKDDVDAIKPTDRNKFLEAARLADKIARMPPSAAKKEEKHIDAAGELPANWEAQKAAAEKRVTNAPGRWFDSVAEGLSRLPKKQQEEELARLEQEDRRLPPHEQASEKAHRARAVEQANLRARDEKADFALPTGPKAPLAVTQYRVDAIRADKFARLPPDAREDKEADLLIEEEEMGLPDDVKDTRGNQRAVALEKALARLGKGTGMLALTPREIEEMMKRADEIMAMPVSERGLAIEADRAADDLIPEDDAKKAYRAAERAKHLHMARKRKDDENTVSPNDPEGWKSGARKADLFVRKPRPVQQVEEERARKAGELPADWDNQKALAEKRAADDSGFSDMACKAQGLARLPPNARNAALETMRRTDEEMELPDDEVLSRDAVRRKDLDEALRRLGDEQAFFGDPEARNAAGNLANKIRDEALAADRFVRLAPKQQQEEDERRRSEESELPEDEREENQLARDAARADALKRMGPAWTEVSEPDFMERADEIMALPPADRPAEIEKTRAKDSARAKSPHDAIALEAHRARHLEMARLRDRDRKAADPSDVEPWKESARKGDRIVRLPPSKQKQAEEDLRSAGELPADWPEHKKLAEARLGDDLGKFTKASSSKADAICRLPKAQQEAEEESARMADEEAGLTPEEIRANEQERAEDLDRCARKLADEQADFPNPSEASPEELAKWRENAEHMDRIARAPRATQEDDEATRMMEDEDAKLTEEERDLASMDRIDHLEKARKRLPGGPRRVFEDEEGMDMSDGASDGSLRDYEDEEPRGMEDDEMDDPDEGDVMVDPEFEDEEGDAMEDRIWEEEGGDTMEDEGFPEDLLKEAEELGISPEELEALLDEEDMEVEEEAEPLPEDLEALEKEWQDDLKKKPEDTAESDSDDEGGDAMEDEELKAEFDEEPEESEPGEEEGVDADIDKDAPNYELTVDDFKGLAFLRPHFVVKKYNPNSTFVSLSKQKRVWCVDLFDRNFETTTEDGKACKEHKSSKLLQLEKNIMDPRRARLMFFDANHSYEIVFASADDRARFFECSQAVRPAVRVWAPAIVEPGAVNSSVVVRDPDAKVSNLEDPDCSVARINASTQMLERISVWVGTWCMNGKKPPGKGNNSDLEYWMPRDKYDVYAISVQDASWRKNQGDWYNYIKAYLGPKYMQLASMTQWDHCLVVLCRKKVLLKVTNIEGGTVPTSMQPVIGKKGGQCIAIRYHETSMCFISCDLAAKPERYKMRTAGIQEMFANLSVHCTDACLSNQFHHTFLMGNLNFRVEDSLENVQKAIEAEDFDALLENDQLRKYIEVDGGLHGFEECDDIAFEPSFKTEGDGSATLILNGDVVPSYTDRILVKSQPGQQITCDLYSTAPEVAISQHLPLFATFRIMTQRPFMALWEEDESPVKFTFKSVTVTGVDEKVPELKSKKPQLSCWCPCADGPALGKPIKKETANPSWAQAELPEVILFTFQREFLRTQHILLNVKDTKIKDATKQVRGTGWLPLADYVDDSGSWNPFEVDFVYLGSCIGKISGEISMQPNPNPNPKGKFGK